MKTPAITLEPPPKPANCLSARQNSIILGIVVVALVVSSALFAVVMVEWRQQGSNGGSTAETVTILALSAELARGEFLCQDLRFSWLSTPNRVEFEALGLAAENRMQAENLGGYAGFSIEKLDSDVLSFSVHGLDLVQQKFELKGDSELPGAEDALLKELIASVIGHCVVDIASQLGLLGIIAKENPALEPLMHLSRVFFPVGERQNPDAWNLESLHRSLEESNSFIKKKLHLREGIDLEVVETDTTSDINRSLKQSCPTSQWFRLGDGRCDPEFNNAACNFDNGDCCSRTCKNYRAAWGTQSPPDGDDITHPVYDCSNVVDSLTCVPSCPASASARARLGDGRCDADLNTEACGFDLGDCCVDTCVSRQFGCGSNGYQCISGSRGVCFRANYCDNEYFGMCGRGSGCARSLCGDCYCHFECQDHDRYCSCEGFFSFGCLNIFRSWCD